MSDRVYDRFLGTGGICMYTFDEIMKVDPEVARAIEAEGKRQDFAY